MSTPRSAAIRAIAGQTSNWNRLDYLKNNVRDLFGVNVFGTEEQRQRLPKDTFKALQRTIKYSAPLESVHANVIATAMKDWAMDKGATHYTHLFQPMTGLTAEKHDSFLTPSEGGTAISDFSGKELIKGEPDASSFPSGGLRATFEARGYTAWDPTSPAFVIENPNGATLVIPTAFLSYTGEALDKKAPLLKSMAALDKQARRLLKLFGKDVQRVTTTVGCEQEYFLIDREFFLLRPDLINCGRTLFGAKPPKGHELDDHYFGSIPDRVLAFMGEVEAELFKLGVPVKTRHNEVAPGQYEVAPIFENTNVATDHQMLVMQVLKKVAKHYGLIALLHEKPFAGVNGSGKHNNFSMSTDEGENLLEPGDSPHENAQFLCFCTAIIDAVHKHGDLIRMAIASAANDHRLGANEAPPAIISIFLGDQLQDVFEQIEKGEAKTSKQGGMFQTGVDVISELPKEAGDRNRTSPFAFTGNKFELRAVGSSSNIAGPNTILNCIVAEALESLAEKLEEATAGGTDLHAAIRETLPDIIKRAKPVLFNGDNYSEEWHAEAEQRGLPNLKSTVDALPTLRNPEKVKTLTRYGVYSESELVSRFNILCEAYAAQINIEGETAGNLAKTMVLPAAHRWLHHLAECLATQKAAGIESPAGGDSANQLAQSITATEQAVIALDKHLASVVESDDPYDAAKHMHDMVFPAMEELRKCADYLEQVVPDDLWPLPSYREMLFIR
jgi:glutamine synthetase